MKDLMSAQAQKNRSYKMIARFEPRLSFKFFTYRQVKQEMYNLQCVFPPPKQCTTSRIPFAMLRRRVRISFQGIPNVDVHRELYIRTLYLFS